MTSGHYRDVQARLGVRPGVRVWVGGHNLEAKRAVASFLTGTVRAPDGPWDLAFITPEAPDEADYFLGKLAGRLPPGAKAWVVRAAGPDNAGDDAVRLSETFVAQLVSIHL